MKVRLRSFSILTRRFKQQCYDTVRSIPPRKHRCLTWRPKQDRVEFSTAPFVEELSDKNQASVFVNWSGFSSIFFCQPIYPDLEPRFLNSAFPKKRTSSWCRIRFHTATKKCFLTAALPNVTRLLLDCACEERVRVKTFYHTPIYHSFVLICLF